MSAGVMLSGERAERGNSEHWGEEVGCWPNRVVRADLRGSVWGELCPLTSVYWSPSSPVPQDVTVFGDRSLERWLRLNEVIWVGPNPIQLVSLKEEEVRTQIHSRKMMWGYRQKMAIYQPRREAWEDQTLTLDIQPPELWDTTFLLFKLSSVWYFVTAAQADLGGSYNVWRSEAVKQIQGGRAFHIVGTVSAKILRWEQHVTKQQLQWRPEQSDGKSRKRVGAERRGCYKDLTLLWAKSGLSEVLGADQWGAWLSEGPGFGRIPQTAVLNKDQGSANYGQPATIWFCK